MMATHVEVEQIVSPLRELPEYTTNPTSQPQSITLSEVIDLEVMEYQKWENTIRDSITST